MNFCEMVKDLRISQGKTLRLFCAENGIDPSNWSKIERGVNPPPKDETVEAWARMLGLFEGTPQWTEFMDAASIARGQIPIDLRKNENLMSKLPVFFRSVRGAELTDAELDGFIDEVRKLNTPD